MMENNNIINRVKKLLALAGNNSDIHEAAAAMAKAQELIARHHISEAMLKINAGSPSELAPIISRVIYRSGRVATWLALLAEAVGEVNGCVVYTVRKYGVMAVGEADDISLVEILLRYLDDEVTRACKQACSLRYMSKSEGRIFANRFKVGAMTALERRLKETHQRVKQEAAAAPQGQYALALLDNKLSRAKQETPKLNFSKIRHRECQDGYASGVEAGNRINLQPNRLGCET